MSESTRKTVLSDGYKPRPRAAQENPEKGYKPTTEGYKPTSGGGTSQSTPPPALPQQATSAVTIPK